MYWVSDKKSVQSLVKRAYDKEVKVKSIVLKEDWQLEKENKFVEKTYYNNASMTDLSTCPKGVVVSDKKDLSDELVEYIKTYNTVPDSKYLKNKHVAITEFYDTINDVVITTDPNDTRCVNYETVKQICEDQEIDFTNQPLTAVIKQMRNKFMTATRAKI